MSFLPDAETLQALKEVINTPGATVIACLVIIGILVYYIVAPIPTKLDTLTTQMATTNNQISEVLTVIKSISHGTVSYRPEDK